MFGLWFFISIIFLALLIISIVKTIRKQKPKKLWIATLVVFIIGFGVFIKAVSDSDKGTEDTKVVKNSQSKESSEFDNAVNNIVDEIQLNTLDTANALYKNDTIDKSKLKELNSKIIDRTDKVKKEIKEDSDYKKFEKRYANDDFDDKEMQEFLSPYLIKIQDLQSY